MKNSTPRPAPASMLFAIYCGIGVVRRSCLTGMLLGSMAARSRSRTIFGTWARGMRLLWGRSFANSGASAPSLSRGP